MHQLSNQIQQQQQLNNTQQIVPTQQQFAQQQNQQQNQHSIQLSAPIQPTHFNNLNPNAPTFQPNPTATTHLTHPERANNIPIANQHPQQTYIQQQPQQQPQIQPQPHVHQQPQPQTQQQQNQTQHQQNPNNNNFIVNNHANRNTGNITKWNPNEGQGGGGRD
eukprot:422788_1